MTDVTTSRIVDAKTARALSMAYKSLVKAGNDSVRAAWRFGQTIDSFSDSYKQYELADAMGLSVSTLHRYRRLYLAYQRPELALKASEELESFNIDVIYELQNQLNPVGTAVRWPGGASATAASTAAHRDHARGIRPGDRRRNRAGRVAGHARSRPRLDRLATHG